MKPSFGSIFWFVVSLSIILYYNLGTFEKKQIVEDDIKFGQKIFTITGNQTDKIFSATGTWTGDGIAYKNNTNRIICYQNNMICTLQSIEQIGEKQLSSIAFPTNYKITKWDTDAIIASIIDEPNCHKSTISILQKIEVIIYTDEFVEYDRDKCKSANKKSYKWTLEDSIFWQKIKK